MKINRTKRTDGSVILRWREPDGRRPQQICANDAEADHFVAQLLLDADNGRLQRRRYRQMTLQDFALEWLSANARDTLAPRTLNEYVRQWDKYIEGALGHLTLEELESHPLHIERFRAQLVEDGIGNATIRAVLVVLQRVLRTAVDWNYLDTNPAARVRKPPARREPADPTAHRGAGRADAQVDAHAPLAARRHAAGNPRVRRAAPG